MKNYDTCFKTLTSNIKRNQATSRVMAKQADRNASIILVFPVFPCIWRKQISTYIFTCPYISSLHRWRFSLTHFRALLPPHPSRFPFSFPRFLAAVPSVERVINRATRWCCNTSWKHYRARALCAVMQESRRGPLISTMPATWLRARNLQFLHYRDRGWRNYGAEGYTCHLLGFIKGSNILTITKEELQK